MGMSDALINEVERTGRTNGTVTIRAPIAGAIQALDVREGMTVAAGQSLAQISGIRTVWLNAAVPEAQANLIRIGQGARIALSAFPGESFTGKVTAILPITQPDSRTMTVRIELANRGGRLRPVIAAIIRAAIKRRRIIIAAALVLAVAGIVSLRNTPVDALPDLSDVQVIIRTSWPGQAPQIIENQVTTPVASTMLSVPGARVVRGYSFTGDSFVYVLFDDGTDLYWARSRVLEYLSQVQSRLPEGASASLGPDATGVGWVYEYALIDKTGRHDLSQLRSLQDWFLRYELKTVPGVAEVASIGGMVKQYQVVLDPIKLAAFGVTSEDVVEALKRANQETGGSSIELAGAEYTVRASGYLRSIEDFRAVPIRTAASGVPVTVDNVAIVQLGPEMRRGIAELNGEGEVAGGVIVMRQGQNARDVIKGVRSKLDELTKSLPPGVEVVTTYDRSGLIDRAIENLTAKLIEEFIVVGLICALFLWHARSALVAILTLPLGILMAVMVMRLQGLNANILSLGGLAIAIGAMVDAAVVMIENAHKHLEHWRHEHEDTEPDTTTRWALITTAASEVGPALFLSLLIITFSFLPIFALQGQEGRLFAPLAFTKNLCHGRRGDTVDHA
uniref:Uncharacterized protein LOC105037650 n=1 Tax=Elaeis guineensis var. tenera TaxID=51953 RepID=A0A6I9QLD4_ELAGV